MKKNGQALVEFIIILPVLIFISLAIVDYGNMVYTKSKLDNMINDVADMYKNNETNDEINKFIRDNDEDIKIDIDIDTKYINIKLTKDYTCITPGLDRLFNTNIVVEREVYNEQIGEI